MTTKQEALKAYGLIFDDGGPCSSLSECEFMARERLLQFINSVPEWRPIEEAPRDETDILVWFDHSADSYIKSEEMNQLTDYAALAESGTPFMGGYGVCVAKWHDAVWETTDEYGSGYWMPAYWFARQCGEYEYVVNPTHFMPLPQPPKETQ